VRKEKMWQEPLDIYEEYDLLNRVRTNNPPFEDVFEHANARNWLREHAHDI
jgi:hypothetical protein